MSILNDLVLLSFALCTGVGDAHAFVFTGQFLDLRKVTTAIAKSEQAQEAHQVLCTGRVGK